MQSSAMAEITTEPLPRIPDDLTIPQFFLDVHHAPRPTPKGLVPWFIEDATGRQIDYEEVSTVPGRLTPVATAFASAHDARVVPDPRPHVRSRE